MIPIIEIKSNHRPNQKYFDKKTVKNDDFPHEFVSFAGVGALLAGGQWLLPAWRRPSLLYKWGKCGIKS